MQKQYIKQRLEALKKQQAKNKTYAISTEATDARIEELEKIWNKFFSAESVYKEIKRFNDLSLFQSICDSLHRVSDRKIQWLKMIEAGKLTCPVTGKKVTYFSLDFKKFKKKDGGSEHYNFYAEDGTLFTVDHIHPKSRGGSAMDLDNLQPMVAKHNWAKGDKV